MKNALRFNCRWLAQFMLTCALACSTFAQSRPFISFDAPDATNGTYPMKINSPGQICGFYLIGSVSHGFLRELSGQMSEFDYRDATSTTPISINNKGQIVGYASFSYTRGFLRLQNGTFFQIVFPGAHDTYAWSINDSTVIAGRYTDKSGTYHGFVRDSAGNFTSFDVTGAGTERGQGTFPYAINNRGEVAGNYVNLNGGHGFLRDAAGNITTFDVPFGTGAWPQALNNNGDIAGYYFGNDGSLQGFVRRADGNFVSFEPPGSTLTSPTAINDNDYVCGENFDSSSIALGFLRLPSGIIVSASGPQPNSGGYCQDINNRLRSTGSYFDSGGITHGWIR